MIKYREILRLTALGFSHRDICSSAGVSQKTVSKVQKRARELQLAWPLDESMTDIALSKKLFPHEAAQTERRMPDFEYVRKELQRNGVTKKLLWTEYLEECRQAGDEPLMYSQFCHYIQQDEEKRRATMHVPRKSGEQVEVDWAADPAQIIDPDTGELTKAGIFIGVMTYSQYTYAEAFVNQREPAWIKAHVHMYEYFGSVAKALVPDNASTAVDHKEYDWYSPKLIRVYREMAEHYNTAIIPARIRKPKDKPNAEGSVNHASTWITAALRNEQFFSIEELNQAIRKKLKLLNSHPFQKKEGSRISLFLGEEKPLLMPLPATRFELATWKQATVQFNYHISVDKMFYSVPFQYIRERVDVRLTDTTVEIFYKNERIASHRRLTGRPGQYATVQAHMPKEHQQYLEWDGDRFRHWAKEVGPNTYQVINSILTSGRIEQQTYRSCMGVMRLADKHSKVKLEAVCRKALQFTASPSYRNIFIIGAAGSGKTYLACAFGLAACMHYYKVRFVRLPDLLIELMPLVGTDAFAKAIKQYTNPRLLIIDEWLLTPLNDDEAKIVFEVIHKRRKKSSTIFCSQFLDEGWYERIGSEDNPLADSIMDRIKYDAYKIKIQALDPDHDRSMREVYGLSPEEAE